MTKVDKGIDKLFDALARGASGIIEPKEHTLWHKIVHEWLSLEAWVESVGDPWCISRGFFLMGLYVPLFIVAAIIVPQFPSLVFGWLLFAFPVWAPVVGIYGTWAVWIWYVQSRFQFGRTNMVLLEVKMPANVTKSPRAMEHVLSNMWTRMSTTTPIDRNWYGGMLPYYSFEITSFGGEVHFYIYTRAVVRDMIEANLYAQYPGMEIIEAEDYASKFVYNEEVECWVTEYGLATNVVGLPETNPLDPDGARINAYPPKTYVDFELDQEPQENRTDPFAQVMEIMSSYQPYEQVWLQMVFRPHFGKKWKSVIEKEVAKIRKESIQIDEHDTSGFPKPTWKQTEQIRTMERHMSKLPFEVGFRGIYSSPADKMQSGNYTAMRWIWRPFSNFQWMSILRPRRGHNIFDWSWQDWNGVRYRLFSRRFLDAYRRRCIFQYPWITQHQIFSTEMLATLWHPPSSTIKSPGLRRVSAIKGEVPANLPV